MEATVIALSPLPESPESAGKKSDDEHSLEVAWEPGPDLKRPNWLRCRLSILGHALRYHLIQIAIMTIALILLFYLVLRWDELRPPLHFQYSMQMIAEISQNIIAVLYSPMFFQNQALSSSGSPSTWIGWWINVQSLLGGGTLMVALFVWYGEIREEWENRLPKRMSVFFLHDGWPAIVCRYVWLAGEGDLRAWGQQVAAQAAHQRLLNFYPNIKAQPPRLAVWTDGKICRHYEVCFDLMDDNAVLLQNLGRCIYQNMATGSNAVHSVPLNQMRKKTRKSGFPFKWPEGPMPKMAAIQNQMTLLDSYPKCK